jgi:hypothetical protein
MPVTKLSLLPVDAGYDPRIVRVPILLPISATLLSVEFLNPRGDVCTATGSVEGVAKALRLAGFSVRFSARREDQP